MHTHSSTARLRRIALWSAVGFAWGITIGMGVREQILMETASVVTPPTPTARTMTIPQNDVRLALFVPGVSRPPSQRFSSASSSRSVRKRRVRSVPRSASSSRRSSVKAQMPAAPLSMATSSSASRMSAVPVRGPAAAAARAAREVRARSASSAAVLPAGAFPPFVKTVAPVSAVPNWGAMHAAAEWNRSYDELEEGDMVPLPSYDLQKLLEPFKSLLNPRDEAEVTRKLVYSTKFFGAYDLDAKEFTANHPGVDIKLALGTPVSAIAGGRVHGVRTDQHLGTYVMIEHRHPTEGTLYSIYAHLGSVAVRSGQDVHPGTAVGTVGMTGSTSAPHLHLQVDRGHGEAVHEPYKPATLPTPQEADRWAVHPIRLIEANARGVEEGHAAAR